MSCGLTAMTTSAAPDTAAALSSVAAIPWRSWSSATRSSRRVEATRSPGARQPEERSPEIERLADPSRAEDRDPFLVDRHGRILGRPRAPCVARRAPRSADAPGTRPRAQPSTRISPGEALPLLVRLEERRRLPPLGPATGERRVELDEREVADEAVVVAAEPLERDHADRPRADPALAGEALEHDRCRMVAEPLEVERRHEPRERGRARLGEPEAAEIERREAAERVARDRRVAAARARRRARAPARAAPRSAGRRRRGRRPA